MHTDPEAKTQAENPFESGFVVSACKDGSFVVVGGTPFNVFPSGHIVDVNRWAFSNVGDLLAWLTRRAAEAPPAPGTGGRALTFTISAGGEDA